MVFPGNLSLNLLKKTFSDFRKSTIQTPLSVEATKTFPKRDELKEE
jgi:hypothetical protein